MKYFVYKNLGLSIGRKLLFIPKMAVFAGPAGNKIASSVTKYTKLFQKFIKSESSIMNNRKLKNNCK